jgi:hypothetical protein
MRIAVWHNLPSGGALRVFDDQMNALVGLGTRGARLGTAECSSLRLACLGGLFPPGRTTAPKPALRHELVEAWRRRRADLEAFVEHCAQCAGEMAAIEPDVVLAHLCKVFKVPALAQFLDAPSVLYLQEPARPRFEAGFNFPWLAQHTARGRPGLSSVRRFVAEAVRVEGFRIQVRDETDLGP